MAKSFLAPVLLTSSCFCLFCGLLMFLSTAFDSSLEFIYSDLSNSVISDILTSNDDPNEVDSTILHSSDGQDKIDSSYALPPITMETSAANAPSSASPINNSDPLQSIREVRIRRPLRCSNSTHHLLPITPSDHNWAPFYFRCNDLYHRDYPLKRPWIDEGLISKELFFVHVFKAGGTTIRLNMNDLMTNGIVRNLTFLGSEFVIYGGPLNRFSKTEDGKYSQHSILDKFIDNNTITFSFVRDPIDKFLSAFYEAHYRHFNLSEFRSPLAAKYGDKSGIQIMRLWIDEMEHRMAMDQRRKHPKSSKANGNVATNDMSSRRRLASPFVNSHLFPNMRFLMEQHYRTSIPFNFIGDLKHFAVDFPQIVEPFIVDEELRRNHTKFMELMERKRVRKGDNWDHKLSKFHIERSELSDDDVQRICDLYWLDYLCLPFDIPVQCHVDNLIEKHYGVDVEYDDCY